MKMTVYGGSSEVSLFLHTRFNELVFISNLQLCQHQMHSAKTRVVLQIEKVVRTFSSLFRKPGNLTFRGVYSTNYKGAHTTNRK